MKNWMLAGIAGMALAASGCSGGPTSPQEEQREVSSVIPGDGAVGVDPGAPIVLDFTHAMHPGMEKYVVVHEGDVNGAAIAGRWTWSADYRRLTFSPALPLKSLTRYTIHMGMGMMNADGSMTGDHSDHHGNAGGVHTGSGMMGSGMMGSGMMGGGMMGGGTSQCVMVTTFTTA